MAKLIKKQETVLLWSDDPSVTTKKDKRKTNSKNTKEVMVIPSQYILKIRLEKNKRAGKLVSVIFELPEDNNFCKKLCKELKSKCGSGGSLKDFTIEIQGDHRNKLKELLENKGFKVILAGG